MVKIEDASNVSLDKNGVHFEILADPDAVLAFREGKEIRIRDSLAVLEIFKDARRADQASESDLQKAFGTLELEVIVKEILKKGKFHPTAEQKRKMVEKVKLQLIELVAQNSVDPRNNLPHTRDRIRWAFDEAKVKIELVPASEQLNGIVKAIRMVLPLRFGTTRLRIIVPSKFAPSLYGKVKSLGKVLKESWLANGSLQATIEIPSGRKVDIMTELGDATKGEVMIKEE